MARQGSVSAKPTPSLRIGEVARRTGLPVKTIRYYCDEGLLQPRARSESGYRLFDEENLAELTIIRSLPVTARKDDAPAADQAAITNVVGMMLFSGGG